ncbi:MAG: spore coat protein [Ethanoligenens sp.]|uniref:spore coat protein n=1 Tax=Ethanoligenens sp. TaxID=2099655 RepID=UPI0039ECCA8E
MTDRELQAMDSHLADEQVLIKKYASLSIVCTDPQLKAKFEQVSARHQDHFNRLLNHLV